MSRILLRVQLPCLIRFNKNKKPQDIQRSRCNKTSETDGESEECDATIRCETDGEAEGCRCKADGADKTAAT